MLNLSAAQKLSNEFCLTAKRINSFVKDGNKDEDESSVDDLHLIRQNVNTANLSIHPGGLESPSRALLVVQSLRIESFLVNVEPHKIY